jgi:integrase
MLESYFGSEETLDRLRSGPSGAYVDGFAQMLNDEGYSWWTGRRYLRSAAHLGRFVEAEGNALSTINVEFLDTFRLHLPRCECPQANGGTTMDVVHGARAFVRYLSSIGVLKVPENGKDDGEPQLVVMFRRWLKEHGGVAESTSYNYCRGATKIIESLGAAPETYDAECLRTFILKQASSLGQGAMKTLISGTRAFLRYLSVVGRCRAGLDKAIPAMARWRLATLPRCLDADEVNRIVDGCDTGTVMGARDHSIILFLARFGLRAGDVVGLRLSDIDWEDASFLVSGKGRREVRLPLTQEVGDALLNYLEVRPKVVTDRVFLRAVAPFRPFRCSGAVSAIVRRAIRRAGIDAPSYGAHILRHSAATQMLHEGASLYQVGTILRHRSRDMTAYYAKADVTLLKLVARPWPEVLGC